MKREEKKAEVLFLRLIFILIDQLHLQHQLKMGFDSKQKKRKGN